MFVRLVLKDIPLILNQREITKMLWEKKARLEQLFLNKMCKIKGHLVYKTGEIQPYKLVSKIEISGPSSGWYWTGWLVFDDGMRSDSFARIRDVEVKGAE